MLKFSNLNPFDEQTPATVAAAAQRDNYNTMKYVRYMKMWQHPFFHQSIYNTYSNQAGSVHTTKSNAQFEYKKKKKKKKGKIWGAWIG